MQRKNEREARIVKQLQQVTISPSAYDTAWVSMVPLRGSTNARRFPECIQWILQNQNANGSWGIEKISKDVLLSTLACVIALKKWNLGEDHMRRGINKIVLPVKCCVNVF
jgi:ent-kaurene synthase